MTRMIIAIVAAGLMALFAVLANGAEPPKTGPGNASEITIRISNG